MDITYNIDYDIAAVLLMLIEIFFLRLQYTHDKYSNRLFIMLLHASFLLNIVDIASSLMLTTYAGKVSVFVLRTVMDLYYLTNAFVFLVFYRYIVEYLGDTQERTVAYYVRTYFPFVFIVECLFANHYANIFFSSGKYGHFSYGSLILIIYIYPLYYYVLTLISLFRNRKSITIKHFVSVLSYIIITIASIVVQYMFSDIMSISFGYAIALLIMMLLLETPDYRNLVKTKEVLENLRNEMGQQGEFNRAFNEEMAREVCIPIAKMLEKNSTYPKEAMDDNQREISEYVEGYGKQVRSVINNIVEFNRIGEAKPVIDANEYDIRALVKEVHKTMLPAVKDKSIAMIVRVTPDIPQILLGHEPLLKQVMINFISDAIRYTDKGTITLLVDYRRIDDENLNLIISVEDTGIGMRRDMVKKLMQFNTKGRDWKKEIYDRSNFNVRISKRLIEKMSGKLHIDSTYRKGSVFTAVIPQTIVDDVV